MPMESMTVRTLLTQQLVRRSHMTSHPMLLDDIFVKSKVAQWIMEIIGTDSAKSLAERIQKTSETRLSHTASTYLLGMAMRDNLDIRFDLLPRLIAGGTGDAFHFFWGMICLCHDLGYEFETKERTPDELENDLEQMKSSSGRSNLLDIRHDLFAVNESMLKQLEIDPQSKTGLWILKAIKLAKNYDALRRQEKHTCSKQPVLDHGICGALILYDILHKEYLALVEKRKKAQSQRVVRHSEHEKRAGILEGVTKDASIVRFAKCSLIIACTVARHNMWLAETAEAQEIYRLYGLNDLFATADARVSASSSLDQMLFLLDFMDTIDPVKGIYTRAVESGEYSASELDARKSFLLDQVTIEFEGTLCQDYQWSKSLIYRRFSFSVYSDAENIFSSYASSTTSLSNWLATKSPVWIENKITFYLPSYPGKCNNWMAGITDHEVNSLLLYLGAGVPGEYGRFYTCPDAYKTLNLLMMPGFDGENVRVCMENQEPDSIYIEEWKKTLDVILSIFSAQCKYAVYASTIGAHITDPLYRADRGINFELMRKNNGTFALTSTAIGGYQKSFLRGKINPHVLMIKIGKGVPYFDYEGFFQDQYVFSDEREVLLPPYIQMTAIAQHADSVDGIGSVTYCELFLDKFDVGIISEDEEMLIYELDHYCKDAANGFRQFVASKDTSVLPNGHPYHTWKAKFQALCRLCMENIYRVYFGSSSEEHCTP